MKKLLFLFCLLFISLISFAQKQTKLAKNGLPLGASVIVIKSTIGQDRIFNTVTKIISQNGFEINKAIEAIGEIQTLHKKVRGGWWLKVIAKVEGNVVILEGLAAGQRYGGQKLINKKRNKHIFPFEAMNELALAIPHDSIEYQ